MNYSQSLIRAEEILGYSFHDKSLLEAALTHPSAVEGKDVGSSYERLEFLGDSILGAIVAVYAYTEFGESDEGALTRIKVGAVEGSTLSEVASELGLDSCIIYGESELGSGGRGSRSALENVYEALVGALYLDAGYEQARRFVLGSLADRISLDLAESPESPKSLLQEITQADGGATPTYKLQGREGPAHEPLFTSVVMLNGERIGRGQGRSKKESETNAALDALERMGKLKRDN